MVVRFMGVAGAYSFGGDFKVTIWGERQVTKGWDQFLWGGVDPSRRHIKILIWQLEEG